MADSMAKEDDEPSRSTPKVAVIIAAYNVAETIGKAVISALGQPETAEVIVVDDASQDDTHLEARVSAGGDPRLAVIRNEHNLGPARSRNIAINQTSSPYIAILDGDDFLLERRFEKIFAQTGWDFCADNIVFFRDETQIEAARLTFEDPELVPITLDLENFVLGNIPNAKSPRAELGFLKPVMRRGFMREHNLAYAEECRLGEDFLFYVDALIRGAVYKVVPQCGYAALVRENSLSGRHSLEDLKALHARETQLCGSTILSSAERRLLKRRSRSTLRRIHHREVLARKAASGSVLGAALAITRPTSFIDILRDRLRRESPLMALQLPRTLLHAGLFIGPATAKGWPTL